MSQLLEQLLAHDTWTTSQLLQRASALPTEEVDREFDIGHRSIRRTFDHLISNMEIWGELIRDDFGGTIPTAGTDDSIDGLQRRLMLAGKRLTAAAIEIENNGRWAESFTDPFDDVEKEYGVAIAHVITHSMHHRAQLLYLLRLCGLKDLPEGDVFSWKTAETPASPSL